jgi:segregation and condensation protein A
MPATHTVSVAGFEGPFDLLLQLIARRKLDVWEVPLAQITDDYLTVLREMAELDLEVTTEFLVIASTLMELKASRLLPDEEDPEAEERAIEARDLLYARLLDYRTFKGAAAWLGRRLADNAGYVPRAVGPDPAFRDLGPPVEVGVGPDRLAEIAARAFSEPEPEEVDTSYLQPVPLTVREAAGMVVDELARADGEATFAELTAGCRHRVEVIVHFLSLLELYKLELVDLDQSACFGTLRVRWELEVPPSQAALAAAELSQPTGEAVWTTDAPPDEPAGAEEAPAGAVEADTAAEPPAEAIEAETGTAHGGEPAPADHSEGPRDRR